MKNQAHSPPGTDHQTKRLLDALEKTVAKLPLEKTIEATKLSDKANPRSFEIATENAHDLVRLLALNASLGSVEAVRDLRHLGILVADILMSLAEIAKEDSESKSEGNNRLQDHINRFYGHNLPIVNISGDFSEVNNILKRESENISKISLISISDWVDSHASINTMNLMTISAPGIFDPNNDMKSHIASTPSDNEIKMKRVNQVRWKPIDFMAKRWELPQELQENSITSHEAIHKIILKLMESRLSALIPNILGATISCVASQSPTWPVLASAFEYKQPEVYGLLDSMEFGMNLPFRLRKKEKPGAPRSFKQGTQAAFALAYCLNIEATRTAYKTATVENLKVIQATVIKLEDERRSRTSGEARRMRYPRDGLWAMKAAMLPPFPSRFVKSVDADRDFEEWHKVAMLSAEATCFGDWDGYPWWPSCVKKRVGYDKKASRNREVKEVVSEKLRQGMEKLLPTGST